MVVNTITRLGPEWAGASVSWGTLKVEDLIQSFIDVLREADSEAADAYQRYFELWMKRLNDDDSYTESQCMEELHYILEDLFDALSDVAPEGCVFGANEGDGSDFGFWMLEGEEV